MKLTWWWLHFCFGGKWIPRFKIQTKRNGSFIFAAREPKRVLKAMTNHIDPNHVRPAP